LEVAGRDAVVLAAEVFAAVLRAAVVLAAAGVRFTGLRGAAELVPAAEVAGALRGAR
jgi:hypothetical protein